MARPCLKKEKEKKKNCNFKVKKMSSPLHFYFPELQVGTRQKELLDIDGSSVILEDGITKLNTIGHYEVRARRGLSSQKVSRTREILS